MAAIEIKNLCKCFGNGGNPKNAAFAIEQFNLNIPDGKVIVVLGPSGCGKSTLLRLISGLISLDSGEVLYDGVDVCNVPPAVDIEYLNKIFDNTAPNHYAFMRH